jgi:hypothetical protein
VSITGLSTTATGTVLTLSDSASTSTVNLIIDNQKEIRFRETTANGTNYVALKAPASVSADLTFTLPATDGTAGQFLKTDGAGSLSFATVSSAGAFKNIIINGDMQIAQRSTSVASITTSGYNTVDRFRTAITTLGTWTQSQSTDVPSGYGFASSLKMDCTTADASPAASDVLFLQQRFEGQNLQYLKKGTANAQSLTLSFWVKSTKTGTFIVELLDQDNSRHIAKSYTVSVSNTWEFKTITFAGDTTGAFTNDNGVSLDINFWLGAGTDATSGTLPTSWGSLVTANRAVGQVNIADSTSNDWLITGIQLEAGTSATDFEFLPIDVSLGRCLRYCEVYEGSTEGRSIPQGIAQSDTNNRGETIIHYTRKRENPTISVNTLANLRINTMASTTLTPTTFDTFNGSSLYACNIFCNVASGITNATVSGIVYLYISDSAKITISAEL